MTNVTKTIKRCFGEFKHDTRGNFNMIFGLLAVPIMVGVGMSVDISRQIKSDVKIQDALDSAALYATTIAYENAAELKTEARKIFDENLAGKINFNVTDFDVVPGEDRTFTLTAKGNLDAMFMLIGGVPSLKIHSQSGAVAKADNGIEIVIAMDTTASMGFGNTWQDATETMDKVLTKVEQYTGDDGFFVSLLPFNDRVRVGSSKESWLSGGSAPNNWEGCVEPREEVKPGFPWASDDDIPSDEPFTASVRGSTGGLAGVFGNGPHCPSVPLTGPTSNVGTLITAAQGLNTNGGTGRFDDAMAWSYRLVSPKWNGLWGQTAYPALDTDIRRKVVIFITDGRTEAYSHELSQERDWGWNQGSEVGFEHMVHVCDQMRADDIEVFMFRVNGNSHAESYMQQCATTPDHYQVIHNNHQLELAFLDFLSTVKVEMHLTR